MQNTSPAPKRCPAFTFVECLVVIATVGLVLLMPLLAISTSRERINRMVCLNNLRQMGVGSQLYAAEDPKGRLCGSLPGFTSPRPDDDLNWLYGYGPSSVRYIQDLKTFICPSTQNSIGTNEYYSPKFRLLLLNDLSNNGRTPYVFGHSYEVMSYWSMGGNFVDKTLENTAVYRKTIDPLAGTIPGPAMAILIFDALDIYTSGAPNDYPSNYGPHGAEGANILFADSHAEWISIKDWSYRWAVSQDTVPKNP